MPIDTPGRSRLRSVIALPLACVMLAVADGSALTWAASPVPIDVVEHPTGSTDVVLSMETGGGLVPFGFFVTQAPTFVLYGDNTAIFRPSVDPSGADLPAFVKATLSAQQVDALLTYALSVGRLADAGERYMEMTVTDAPDTVFTVDAAGVAKTVSVYALGIAEPTGPDGPMYAAFEELATVLATFERQVEAGNVLSAEAYQPPSYRAVLSERSAAGADVIDWPFADLPLDQLEPFPQNPAFRLGALTPEQLSAVTVVPSGGGLGVPIRSPDGTTGFLLQWRPLLPGEELRPAVLGGKGF